MLVVWIILGVGILFTVVIIVAGVVLSRRGDSAALERLERVTSDDMAQTEEDADRDIPASRTSESVLTQKLDQVIEERGLGRNVAVDLARADLKITVAEFWAITVISVVLTGGVAWLIYGGWIFLLLGAVGGYFIPKIFVKIRQGRRLKRFNDQLGDGITLMANGLRAGYSMLQAMDAVAREMPAPLSAEFRRVVQEIGLGIEQERALNNLVRRVPSDDLDLMITAIGVQSEVGGNLAEILEIIGFVIRERVRIKGEIQVLTAQAQYSGYVITVLPIILGFILYAMNPDYVGRMIFSCQSRGLETCAQPCGWIMIGTGIISVSVGFFAMRKVTDIEV